MLPAEGDKKFSIPPEFDAIYENFNLVTETASYLVFEALTRQIPQEKHSIRILDPTKDLVKNNFNSAATLFIQELFQLHTRCPGSVLINTLEISETRKQIACAIRQYSLVTSQLQEIQGSMNLKNPKMIEKLLNDVISDIEFLWRDLKMKNIASIMEPENIYFIKEKGIFFLGNWDKRTAENPARTQDLTSRIIDSIESGLRSQDIAAEIRALAFALLKMKKVKVAALESLLNSEEVRISIYDAAVKSTVAEGFSDSQKLQNLVERMLSLDHQNLPNLEEFKIKEDKIPENLEKDKNEACIERKEVGIQVAFEDSKIDQQFNSFITNSPFISTPSTLLARCSGTTNKISVIDLETKQNYVTFDGARISDAKWSQTHVKEITNTKLLVSLNHQSEKFANMEIFDVSKKGKAKKVYSLGGVSGSKLVVGDGDVTYNSRRGILGAIPVTGRIAYHLFTIDTRASNDDDIVKLNRKSKWYSQSSPQKGNYITSFDFNPAGEFIATVDADEMCLISDVNTNNYVFNLKVGDTKDPDRGGCCRWSTDTGEPSLFLKCNYSELSILDLEVKVPILTYLTQLDSHTCDENGTTYCIDVCQSNPNLVATGGNNNDVYIFDRRKRAIVETFGVGYLGDIYCVHWSPRGDMIASASRDGTAILWDFKTTKILHTGTTTDEHSAYSVCFM